MRDVSQQIPQLENVDGNIFENENLANQPVLLKGFVSHWLAVQAALTSDKSICEYLRRFDNDQLVKFLYGPPDIKGRFFYRDDMKGFNFEVMKCPLKIHVRPDSK